MRLLSIFILLSATTVFGQLRITGKVVDPDGEPMPGANIIVKNTIIGTIANKYGEFELNISSDSVIIVVSYVGDKHYELKVYESSFVEIRLQEPLDDFIYFGRKPLKLPIVTKEDCDLIDMKSAVDFINDVFTNDSSKFNVSNETNFGMFEIDSVIINDSVFSAEDRKYICTQLACVRNFKWEQNQIRGATIIKETKTKRIFKNYFKRDGWAKFKKKYGECLIRFGVPIFTVNGEYCIFYWWIQCDYLAGGGNLGLYKKVNGSWQKIKVFQSGFS